MRAANPYNYNLPVGPEMFFGRQRDIEILTHHLTATPGDSFALIGGRRMGKTSLLEALLQALEPLIKDPSQGLLPLPVLLDLSGEGIDSVIAFFHTVGERAQDALTDLALPPTGALAVGENQPPAPAFRRMLKSWGRTVMEQRGYGMRLILLLDECEQIVERPWAPDLYGALRYLLVGQTTRPLLKVVMAGSHRFLTQVRQRGSPLRNVLKYYRICVLDGQATQDLITQPTGGVLPEGVVQAIAGQSGGHPFLTQYLMHHLWEHGLEHVTPETVREVAAGFCHERSDFWDWIDGLGDICLRIYWVLAQAREALIESHVRATLRPAPPDLLQALDALCYHGLVVREAGGEGYRVAGQMFREWFETNVAEHPDRDAVEKPKPVSAPQIITWLHLSDLHFRESSSYDENIVLKALLRDIAKCSHDDSLQPDFIILSGDIAFASRSEEYALAQQFLDELLETTGLPKDCLFLVPGNHDVDRDAISALAAGATAILSKRDAVNRFLADDDDRARVFQRFHNYQEFVNRYLDKKHTPFDSAHYFYVKHIEVAGRRVAILGLNSAWLAASDEDRNRLLLGERQVRTALDAAEDADLRLAVMHHPFDWLQDFDRDDVEPLLCSKCDFVLHGHMHQVGLLQAHTPDTEAMIIAAGACYKTRQYPNSYNLVQLDFSTGKGTVYLRMYSDRRGGFWAKDVVNYRNVDDGVYTFSLSDRLRQSFEGADAETTTRVLANKKQVKNSQVQEFARVTLVLEGIDSFGTQERNRLLIILSDALGIDGEQIRIARVQPGSLRVELELPSEAAAVLEDLVRSGQLDLVSLMRQVVPPETTLAGKYSIHITNAQGVIIGDRAQVTQHFGAPTVGEDESGLSAAEERALLKQELAQHERNLYTLREQAAVFAAGERPLHLLNQIKAEEEEIKRIEVELERLER
ncbi:MAG: metallophosphoesterase [Anaerolineae bacterium]